MCSSDKPRGFTVSTAEALTEDVFAVLVKFNEEDLTDSVQKESPDVLQAYGSSREMQMGSAVFKVQKSFPAACEMISEESIAKLLYENSNLVKEIKSWQDSVKNLKGQLHESYNMFVKLTNELETERCRNRTLWQCHHERSSALVEAKNTAKETHDFINDLRHKNLILAKSVMHPEKKRGVLTRLKEQLAKGFQHVLEKPKEEMQDKSQDKKKRGLFKRLKRTLAKLTNLIDSQALVPCDHPGVQAWSFWQL